MIITVILLIINISYLISDPAMHQLGTINAIVVGMLLSNILWQISNILW